MADEDYYGELMDSDSLEGRVESLEADVDQLNRTVENIEATTGNAVTTEQLEQVKSDLKSELLWKMVMYVLGALALTATIIGVVVGIVLGILTYMGRQPTPPVT